MKPTDRGRARLIVDLRALAENWRRLEHRAAPAALAAVVKADAYGLGIEAVAPALRAAGCARFFVATLDEGLELRRLLPGAEIAVLNGLGSGEEALFAAADLVPVLNDLGQVARWHAHAGRTSRPLGAIVNVDTGMCRLGIDEAALARLAAEPERLSGLEARLVMSHLACADEPDNPKNAEQLERFGAALRTLAPALGRVPASLANSSAIFLGPRYHFDLVRPGAAVYGINPSPGAPNPMAEVVRLEAPIIQVRRVDRPETVGYGATHRISRPSRIATVPVGYADGFMRSLSNRASGFVGSHRVPLVGRVSMDLITLDISEVPEDQARIGATVTLIGGPRPADDVAAEGGTIAYELFTRLGRRFERRYLGAEESR